MTHFQTQSASEQVAAHLKDKVEQGEWSGTMPGEEVPNEATGRGSRDGARGTKAARKSV